MNLNGNLQKLLRVLFRLNLTRGKHLLTKPMGKFCTTRNIYTWAFFHTILLGKKQYAPQILCATSISHVTISLHLLSTDSMTKETQWPLPRTLTVYSAIYWHLMICIMMWTGTGSGACAPAEPI